jgi:hypothetical protein
MCTATQLWSTALFLLFILCGIFAVVQESRFMSRFSSAHPDKWRRLENRGRWLLSEDRDHSYAGAQWYLIFRGEYRELEDPLLRQLGRKARRAMLATAVFLAALALHLLVTQSSPSFRCLSSVWQ